MDARSAWTPLTVQVLGLVSASKGGKWGEEKREEGEKEGIKDKERVTCRIKKTSERKGRPG